jgi:hypothetical protein
MPERIARLPRDRRGLPIPFLVLTDRGTGKPNFTINDAAKQARCLAEDRCPICGEGLTRGRWFVGGPGSAFHPNGAYLDPPMHFECAHFALRVCPFLAAPVYSGRIDDKGFDWSAHPGEAMLVDPTVIAERPSLFVAIMAVGQKQVGPAHSPYLKPRRPYSRVEFWRFGRQLDEAEGVALALAAADSLDVDKIKAAVAAPPRLIRRPEARA